MKHILLFGAGKSAGVLIKSLLVAASAKNWKLTVTDVNAELARQKIGGSPNGEAISFDIAQHEPRMQAISDSDLVISLLPPALHILVAKDCLKLRKHLLTASYVDAAMLALHEEAVSKDLLFLCETGLDPGIDHMSAMRLIQRIKGEGGNITAFFSHCGGLVAPESDDNPWHYKISWNPANIVNAGRDGARFVSAGQEYSLTREQLFDSRREIQFPGYGRWLYYPNRDSVKFAKLYALESADAFLRTTIRHEAFMQAWSAIVHSKLIDMVAGNQSFLEWSFAALRPLITPQNKTALEYLGLFSEEQIPRDFKQGAQIIQYLLETRLLMREQDKDLVLMMHEVYYSIGSENRLARSYFSMKGIDSTETAMATTVGLPLARAAELMLNDVFKCRGVQVPILAEIYEPLLASLENDGIVFQEADEGIVYGVPR